MILLFSFNKHTIIAIMIKDTKIKANVNTLFDNKPKSFNKYDK